MSHSKTASAPSSRARAASTMSSIPIARGRGRCRAASFRIASAPFGRRDSGARGIGRHGHRGAEGAQAPVARAWYSGREMKLVTYRNHGSTEDRSGILEGDTIIDLSAALAWV